MNLRRVKHVLLQPGLRYISSLWRRFLELNYKHLFYFFTICVEGSIVQASRKLHITQPTLSGQLKQFEDYLGVKLFDRKTRKLVLNEKGKAVYEHARRIFKLGEELIRSARTPHVPLVSIVKIGIIPSLSRFLVYDFLVPLLADSNIAVTVIEDTLSVLIKKLNSGTIDLVLSDVPSPEIGSKMKSSLLRVRDFVAVANRKMSHVKKNFPASLEGIPFVTFTDHSQLRTEINNFFEKNRITPAIVGEFDDVTLLKLIVERGRCITILPVNTVRESVDAGKLIELGKIKSLQSNVWAITGKKALINDVVKETIKVFKEGAGKIRRESDF